MPVNMALLLLAGGVVAFTPYAYSDAERAAHDDRQAVFRPDRRAEPEPNGYQAEVSPGQSDTRFRPLRKPRGGEARSQQQLQSGTVNQAQGYYPYSYPSYMPNSGYWPPTWGGGFPYMTGPMAPFPQMPYAPPPQLMVPYGWGRW